MSMNHTSTINDQGAVAARLSAAVNEIVESTIDTTAGARGMVLRFTAAVRRAYLCRKTQHLLRELSDEQLADIGVVRDDIDTVALHSVTGY